VVNAFRGRPVIPVFRSIRSASLQRFTFGLHTRIIR